MRGRGVKSTQIFSSTQVKVQILSENLTQLKVNVSGQKYTWVKVKKSTTLNGTQVKHTHKGVSSFIILNNFLNAKKQFLTNNQLKICGQAERSLVKGANWTKCKGNSQTYI